MKLYVLTNFHMLLCQIHAARNIRKEKKRKHTHARIISSIATRIFWHNVSDNYRKWCAYPWVCLLQGRDIEKHVKKIALRGPWGRPQRCRMAPVAARRGARRGGAARASRTTAAGCRRGAIGEVARGSQGQGVAESEWRRMKIIDEAPTATY